MSRELGIEDEIASAIEEIEKSIQFDLDRILSPKKIRNKESLKENFHKMDIEGTIS
ncbi:MAG: hypothetical protein LBC61_07805 [Candidatus Peribacteria bacterium]|nr:hypothetical protein [Candidatus Peribacteria bacterium]